VLISVELLLMLLILLFIRRLRRPLLLGFAIGESLGAAALRVRADLQPRSLTSAPT